jgi:methionyl-tRNA synthetase
MRYLSQTNITNIEKAVLIFLAAWALVWKGIALWKASRGKQKYWYIALLILNTVGIFDIFYILFFQKKPVFSIKRLREKFKISS